MKYLKIAFIFSLVLMISAGCSKEEIQPDPPNDVEEAVLSNDDSAFKGAKKKFVPFKGEFSIDEIDVLVMPGPGIPPPKIQNVIATGKANHLGKTTVNLYQEWWRNLPPYDDGSLFTGRGIGNLVFTSANGDKLFATYDDAFANHLDPPPITIVTFTGEITGGEGRFYGAEGWFDWYVLFNSNDGSGTVKLTGQIKY